MSGPWVSTPERLWYAQDAGPGMRLARAALWPFSLLYGAGAALHRGLYRWGVRAPAHAPVPVLAVGNVVAGGAGKTPVVRALARLALEQGIPTAVLCRGYGAQIPREGWVVSSGTGPQQDWRTGGDEPWLLAQALPGVGVLAGPNRAVLAARAAAELGARLVLLDDGMQHWRLHQDALVAVVRQPAPLGNGLLLPAGPLREHPRALRRADVVVALGGAPPELRAALERLGVDPGRVVPAVLEPRRLRPVPEGVPWSLDSLRGLRVWAAAAIGRPSALQGTLEHSGARVLGLEALPDHAALDVAALAALRERAARAGAQALVLTEKDAVKLPPVPPGLPVLCLEVEVAFPEAPGAGPLLEVLRRLAKPAGPGLT